MAQPVAQPAVDNSVVKPIPVDIPQQNTMNASYQQYMPSQNPQIPTDNNSLNQTLLPNNQPQEQVRVGRFGIELLPPGSIVLSEFTYSLSYEWLWYANEYQL